MTQDNCFEKSSWQNEVIFPDALTLEVSQSYNFPIETVYTALLASGVIAAFDVSKGELCVGNKWYDSIVSPDGNLCEFFGEYLEITPPTKISQTWHFAGWSGVEAVLDTELQTMNEQTTRLSFRYTFRTEEGRAHMIRTDGIEDDLNKIANYLEKIEKDNS